MKQLFSGDAYTGVTFPVAIYEKMLQCIVSNPSSLLSLEDIMKKLDKEIVTEEFRKMYNSFKEIAERTPR